MLDDLWVGFRWRKTERRDIAGADEFAGEHEEFAAECSQSHRLVPWRQAQRLNQFMSA